MILITGSKRSRSSSHSTAFTLIELILVMTVLMVVLAVAAPSLQGFFKGRNLDSEARRLLGLTRYGQSRAASEGVPMLLWVNWKSNSYGLRAASGFLEIDPKENKFKVDKSLKLEVEQSPTNQTPFNLDTDKMIGNLPTIRFLPDGSISETSPVAIKISQTEKDVLWVSQSTNRLRYEIQKNDFWRMQR